MRYKESIVYVNFSPYDNAGRFLDFLVANFPIVMHFSYDHLRLENGRRTNILTIYKNGHAILQKQLIPIRTPPALRFPSLPIVAVLIFIQTWWYIRKNSPELRVPDYYLTVNAYSAWVGNFLKKLGVVKKTIFWVWDYFPAGYPDIRIKILRWVYWKFDRPSVLDADVIASISDKLITLRHKTGVLPKNKKYRIVPIGTNPILKVHKKRGEIIGFLGMLKASQGLDLFFNALPLIIKFHPQVKIEIIGSGPEERYFKKRAKRWRNKITFHGFVEKEDAVDRIMRRWSIGLATYRPDPSNESYWTDPSKIKAYLSQGVPVVTTKVPYFAQEIHKHKAGVVLRSYDESQLVSAIGDLLKRKNAYAKRALRLSQKYSYRKLYRKLFKNT